MTQQDASGDAPAASYVNGADLVVDGGFWASLPLTGSLWDEGGSTS